LFDNFVISLLYSLCALTEIDGQSKQLLFGLHNFISLRFISPNADLLWRLLKALLNDEL